MPPPVTFFSGGYRKEQAAKQAIRDAATAVAAARDGTQATSTSTTTLPTPSVLTQAPTTPATVPQASQRPAAIDPPMLGKYKVEVPARATSPFTATTAAPPPSIEPSPGLQAPLDLIQSLLVPVPVATPTPTPAPPAPKPTILPAAPLIAASFSAPSGITSQDNEAISRLLEFGTRFPALWETTVGLYLQHSERTPLQISANRCSILQRHWRPDLLKHDRWEQNPLDSREKWTMDGEDPIIVQAIAFIRNNNWASFEAAIRQWANNSPQRAEFVLTKAGWRQGMLERCDEWYEVDRAMKLPDGAERSQKLAHMEQQSPRFFQFCKDDTFCGIRRHVKRTRKEDELDSDYYYDEHYQVSAIRKLGTLDYDEYYPKQPPRKIKPWLRKEKMSPSGIMGGRPTQFHAVPLEDRAIDSKGNRMPWQEVWPEGHPNARGQKRHVEEKGPFGKSNRRKGSSRSRITVTPAKKENVNLDGWEKAWKFTQAQREREAQRENKSARPQHDGNVTSHHAPSHSKEPTQIMLFGYQKSREYRAIDLFEKISGGIICENYPRGPPAMHQKYPTITASDTYIHPRKLTLQERKLAAVYSGGESWVKLTCDSAEAAARAVEGTGQAVSGHWVYAELWQGQAPAVDEPIPIRGNELVGEAFGSPRPPPRTSQSLSAAFSRRAGSQQQATATLPRSFNQTATSQANSQQPNEATSSSPSTASSATATGSEYPDSRNRQPFPVEGNGPSSTIQNSEQARIVAPGEYNPAMMRHFQDRPRTILRPASEAFLPMPTWWERQTKRAREAGWIPGDFIGDTMPITANGEFDWAAASWYWRFWHMVDTHLGTNICGLKDS